MTCHHETSIIATSVSDPDPDSRFFLDPDWVFLAGSGSGFDEYGSDNTDFNISRNSIMVPIVELFKILIKMASCYTCSRPFKKSDLDPGAHKQKQKI